MFKERLPAIAVALGICLAAPVVTFAQAEQSGYLAVNGLEMYYELHGAGRPLVLLHGALTTIETSFGKMLPTFAKSRQVIAVEQQGHGRTADIDRPLSYAQMAEDTVALLRQLGIEQVDVLGYSMGGGIALEIALNHPELVRKLVLAAANYRPEGYYPEVLAAIEELKPEDLAGSPFQESYASTAPDPERWPALIAKVQELDRSFAGWSPAAIRSITAPTLVIVGDADVVRPEHAVELFRLLGGGVPGDLAGLPRAQLAVLPGTTHITLVERADWLTSTITAYLDAAMPEAK